MAPESRLLGSVHILTCNNCVEAFSSTISLILEKHGSGEHSSIYSSGSKHLNVEIPMVVFISTDNTAFGQKSCNGQNSKSTTFYFLSKFGIFKNMTVILLRPYPNIVISYYWCRFDERVNKTCIYREFIVSITTRKQC